MPRMAPMVKRSSSLYDALWCLQLPTISPSSYSTGKHISTKKSLSQLQRHCIYIPQLHNLTPKASAICSAMPLLVLKQLAGNLKTKKTQKMAVYYSKAMTFLTAFLRFIQTTVLDSIILACHSLLGVKSNKPVNLIRLINTDKNHLKLKIDIATPVAPLRFLKSKYVVAYNRFLFNFFPLFLHQVISKLPMIRLF